MNWANYNESLVRRGEILLDFDVVDNWDSELVNMNKHKKGRKFVYQDSFIKLLGYMRVYFHLPYRQTEGVVRAHASNTLPSIPDYSRICRRINRLNIKIIEDDNSSLHDDYFVIAIDSTGIKGYKQRRLDTSQVECQKRISKDTCSSRYQKKENSIFKSN